jgi:hypothetical protein
MQMQIRTFSLSHWQHTFQIKQYKNFRDNYKEFQKRRKLISILILFYFPRSMFIERILDNN